MSVRSLTSVVCSSMLVILSLLSSVEKDGRDCSFYTSNKNWWVLPYLECDEIMSKYVEFADFIIHDNEGVLLISVPCV